MNEEISTQIIKIAVKYDIYDAYELLALLWKLKKYDCYQYLYDNLDYFCKKIGVIYE